MSPIDSILGLKGLVVQRVERKRDIHVWARPRDRPACVYCSYAVVRIKATHQRTLKHTRQGNQLMVLHLAVPKYHCTHCNRYFRHRFTGIRPHARATETYRRIARKYFPNAIIVAEATPNAVLITEDGEG